MKDIIDLYIKYIKDNPKKLWFKRKIYGWGWTPVKWQGWLTIILYIFIILISIPDKNILDIVLATILLIYICYKKGEKPRWQWGLKDRYFF